MYLDQAKKKEIFEKHGKNVADTGSAESQIALFTYRISHLTEHLKKNHKDFGTALYNKDINRYRAIIKALGLRK